jgi:GAF domain
LSLSVVFVGIPDIPTIMKLPAVFSGLVGRRCERLDEQMKRACVDHPRAIYLPFIPPEGDLLQSGDRHTYARWAALIAPTVARILNTQLLNPRDPARIIERARQLALDDLHILDTAPDERFDRIVASARDLFGVAGASILFLDRDRQWTKASTGIDPMDTPRGSALADATVNNGKMFVLNDASMDERFSGHPWVTGRSRVRFFAGFPIEAPNGQRVGVLCLVDPAPRAFSELEGSLLGQLAQQVQTDLWGSRTPVR